MSKYSRLNEIRKPLRAKRDNRIYNIPYRSHYKIYNEIDGYCYFGTTKNHWLNRVVDFMGKRIESGHRLLKIPSLNTRNQIIDETLYGKGPWETGYSRLAVAIYKYGFENFSCQLLSRGAMTLPVAEAIEDMYINNSKKVYNFVKNQRPDVSSSTIETYKSSEYDYVDYKNNQFKGFYCIGMDIDSISSLLWEKDSFANQIC